jgi:hypothetical protein
MEFRGALPRSLNSSVGFFFESVELLSGSLFPAVLIYCLLNGSIIPRCGTDRNLKSDNVSCLKSISRNIACYPIHKQTFSNQVAFSLR